MSSAIVELDLRSGDEVSHCAGDEQLARTGECTDTGCDMYGEAAEVFVSNLAFAGVESGTHVNADPDSGVDDVASATNRAGWAVEGCEEAIACSVDFSTAIPAELFPHGSVVGVEQ